MQFLDCPRCRARFHPGFAYAQLEACPRCGAYFHESLSDSARLHRVFGYRAADDVPDWETITGPEYAGTGITRTWRRAAQ